MKALKDRICDSLLGAAIGVALSFIPSPVLPVTLVLSLAMASVLIGGFCRDFLGMNESENLIIYVEKF